MDDLQALCHALTTSQSQDWDALADLAIQHDLAGYLLYAAQLQGIKLANPDVRAAAATIAAANYALHEQAMKRITQALDSSAIPHVWLKGAALGLTIYPDPALRALTDLDILVAFEQRHHAIEAVKQVGFTPSAHKPEYLFDLQHEAEQGRFHHFVLENRLGVVLELHFRLFHAGGSVPLQPAQLDRLIAQAAIYDRAELTLRTLQPEAHLIYLCAHLLYHHAISGPMLKWYLDLHLLITHYTLDWEAVIAQAGELGWATASVDALARTQALFDTHIPPDVFERLRAAAVLEQPPTRLNGLTSILSGSNWREKLGYVLRVAIPPPDYMRARHNVSVGQRIWLYYVFRWYNELRQVIRAWIDS